MLQVSSKFCNMRERWWWWWCQGRGGQRAKVERWHITASKPTWCLSPASCRSPFSHSWLSAGWLPLLWSPRWPTPGCCWSPSCRQTCEQDEQEEEQEVWGQSAKAKVAKVGSEDEIREQHVRMSVSRIKAQWQLWHSGKCYALMLW